MGLVDYSSGSESESPQSSTAAAKRLKTSHSGASAAGPAKKPPLPPPLPAAFHDLYASTVRVSTVDDPSLHQGRKRVNPHKAGNWPSHIYIDVQPSESERATLSGLLASTASKLGSSDAAFPIHSFLSSDLGAEQPLHISLSRPLSLETPQKSVFLDQARGAVESSGIAPFKVRVLGVYWHRTRESARSFLVLKVTSAETHGVTENHEKDKEHKTTVTTNSELQALLARFNKLASSFGQPTLYDVGLAQPKRTKNVENEENRDRDKPATTLDSKSNVGEDTLSTEHFTSNTTVRPPTGTRDAFHISIAWSPAEPTAVVRKATADVARVLFSSPTPNGTRNGSETGALYGMQVPIDAVKVKIGNVITSIALGSGTS